MGWFKLWCFELFLTMTFFEDISASDQRPQKQNEQGYLPPAAFLSKYIQIPSVTGNEKAAGEFLAAACREKGLHVRIFSDQNSSFNFAASLYPLSLRKPNIVFLHHIDVVHEGDPALWTYPPYSGAIAEGNVWGRGSIDNKGLGVVQLFALTAFVEEAAKNDLPYNFTLLAVSNEEADGSLGAGLVTEKYFDELNPVAIYGEGGGGFSGVVKAQPELVMFGVELAQKRALWLLLTAKGATIGHGSFDAQVYPAKELTLATAAILNQKRKTKIIPLVREMFSDIGANEKGLRKLAMKHIRLFAPFISRQISKEELISSIMGNTITLSGIGASESADNQMSHGAWATFDVRLLPGVSSVDFLTKLKKRIKKYRAELTVIKERPQSPISEKGVYYQALKESIAEIFGNVAVVPMLFPATNDNLFFRAKGIPAYGMFPAVFRQEHVHSIHNIDERIPIKALDEGIALYNALIRNLLQGLASEKKL